MNDVVGISDQVVGGGVRGAQLGVPGVLNTATTGVASTLDQQKREFTKADRTNGTLQAFVEQSPVGTMVKLGEHECEVIRSGSEKLLMLSKIIEKNQDGMRDITRRDWVNTIAQTMSIPGLTVMSREQMQSIGRNQDIFPVRNTYLSSSPYNNDCFFGWNPAVRCWYGCNANDANYDYYDDFYDPMALRCVVELS